MRTMLSCCLLLTTVLLPGCAKGALDSVFGKSEGDLKGEVFIVTKGAVNFKLGLVEVTAIPESEINAYLEKIKKQIDLDIAILNREIATAEKEFTPADDLYHAKERRLKEAERTLFAKDIYAKNARDNKTFATMKRDEQGHYDPVATLAAKDEASVASENAERESTTASNDYEKAKREYDEALSIAAAKGQVSIRKEEKLKKWPTAEFYFESLPKGLSHAVTDADGKFTIKVPSSGRFALAAHSRREILGSTEEYYWLIWASLDGGKSTSVMLTNKNLMTEQSADSVAQAKATSLGTSSSTSR